MRPPEMAEDTRVQECRSTVSLTSRHRQGRRCRNALFWEMCRDQTHFSSACPWSRRRQLLTR